MDEETKDLMAKDLSRLWDGIGADVLQAREDAGMSAEMDRDEVIDVCVDMYVGGCWSANLERGRMFGELSLEERKSILDKAFNPQFKTWGW